MNEAYSAAELAVLGIEFLPKTAKGIAERAQKEKWPFRRRAKRGGGVEYETAKLPERVQAAIFSKATKEIATQMPAPPVRTTRKPKKQLALSLDEIHGLTDKQKTIANARLSIVAEVRHLKGVLKISKREAVLYFIKQFETGKLDDFWVQQIQAANARPRIDAKTGQAIIRICPETVENWINLFEQASAPSERLYMLAPATTQKKKTLNDRWWLSHFANFHCRPQKPPMTQSYEQFAEWWVKNMEVNDLPSLSIVRRVWKSLPVIVQERGRKTGQAYKSLLPYVQRDWSKLNPNDVWIGDGHSFKAKVAHPNHGQPYVPEITVVIDGCTRKIMGFSVSLAENKKAVADALRIGMKYHGLPLIYYSDNGAGQTAKTIDHPIIGLCSRLGIHHETGLPGNPQGRGIIEGIWDITLIKQARQYATFTGNQMDESTEHKVQRKLASAVKAEKDGKELTIEQKRYRAMLPSFKRFMADLIETINAYNARPHSSLPRKADGDYYSPAEYYDFRIAEMPKEQRPEMLNETELDMLYRPEEIRTVDRGWLSLLNDRYFSMDLAMHHGEQVRVAFDWDNPHDVMVYAMDGSFICKALLNGNLRPTFDVKSIAEKMQDKRAANQIRRKQNDIRRIMLDTRGGLIDSQPDFASLLMPSAANEEIPEINYMATGTDGKPEHGKPKYKFFED